MPIFIRYTNWILKMISFRNVQFKMSKLKSSANGD